MGYFWSQFKLIGNDRNFEDCARGVETILNTPVDLVSVTPCTTADSLGIV